MSHSRIMIHLSVFLDTQTIRKQLNLAFMENEREIIGYITCFCANFFEKKFIYFDDILCGSDAYDTLLEQIQQDGMWGMWITDKITAIIYQVSDAIIMADTYEKERSAQRAELLCKWAIQEPTEEKAPMFHWSSTEEAKYQEHLTIIKRVNARAGPRIKQKPNHFKSSFIEINDEHIYLHFLQKQLEESAAAILA